jgi:hypothetical protein
MQYGPLSDEQKFSGKAWTNQITSGIYDYLPKTARIAAQGPAKDYVDEISPSDNNNYTLTDSQKGSDWMYFRLNLSHDSRVTLAQLAFQTLSLPIMEVKLTIRLNLNLVEL